MAGSWSELDIAASTGELGHCIYLLERALVRGAKRINTNVHGNLPHESFCVLDLLVFAPYEQAWSGLHWEK